MRGWLERRSKALQAVAAVVTSIAAVAALVGVKVQIDASARQQREQSARDIYREFLNISINKPEFADPDYCTIKGGPHAGAYEDYVAYLIYTAEQMLAASSDWDATVLEHMDRHKSYICEQGNWENDSPEVRALIARFRHSQCGEAVEICP